ncbi:MAG TPA: signal peptidase I [Gaiellaceae bacterium]|nr:signal peptidase I [Gaiellaceae bacterium]
MDAGRLEPRTHTALRLRGARRLSLPDLALRAVLGVAFAVFLLLALLPHTGLYRTETVLSNSMKPYFGAGDLLVVTPEPLHDVRVGQVISLHVPNGDHHVQTHRIVQVVRGGAHPVVRTKGDANDARDQFTARLDGKTAWQVRLVVPKVGWLIVWLRNPLLRLLTVFLAPAAFALMAVRRIWIDPDDGDVEEVPDAPSRVAPLA